MSAEYDDKSVEALGEEDELPLMFYERCVGPSGLPRTATAASANNTNDDEEKDVPTLSPLRTCQSMGRLTLNKDTLFTDDDGETDEPSSDSAQVDASLFAKHPLHVTAFGFEDGTVKLVDAPTGSVLRTDEALHVRDGRTQHIPVVATSWDASATYLGGIDQKAHCVVWEFKYQVRLVAPTASAAVPSSNMLNLWGLLRPETQPTAEATTPVPQLVAKLVSAPYRLPLQGTTTCLVLDPAYAQRREKCLLVGMQDGRLVRSKRGFFLQRRVDDVIYQGTAGPVEAVTWRGNLVAWADATGLRILETDTWTRLAHVDRPHGARPQLYPSLTSLRPSMSFETPSTLLVAWGDCLLSLEVVEPPAATATTAATNDTAPPSSEASSSRRRRQVECRMAWELDCVACSVAPLDAQHVAILGLVSDVDGEDDSESNDHKKDDNVPMASVAHYEVELQMVSRVDGKVVYSDILPLARPPRKPDEPERVSDIVMSSSFRVPVTEEWLDYTSGDDDGGSLGTRRAVPGSHLRWNLEHAAFSEGDENEQVIDSGREQGDKEDSDDRISDDGSEDSDDYGFVQRPFTVNAGEDATSLLSVPPIINLSSPSDTIVGRLRNVDDAIAMALEQEQVATALKFALRYMRRLRRHKLDDIVNEYFRRLLKLEVAADSDGRGQLSLRRVKIAAAALPTLIGGNVELWQKWIDEFEKIPGALFVIHDSLPVRDPILPKEVYSRILVGMNTQIDRLRQGSADSSSQRLLIEAENRFLDSLVLWGSVDTLKEFIRLYTYQSSLDASYQRILSALKLGLDYRTKQSAERYLRFSAVATAGENEATTPVPLNNVILFDVDTIEELLQNDKENTVHLSSRVVHDARARLFMMQQRYDDALRELLSIGCSNFGQPSDSLKQDALDIVRLGISSADTSPYAHVVAFIEKHHLHQSLLKDKPLESSEGSPVMPLEALMRLVGVDCAGRFLFQHCGAAGGTAASSEQGLTLLPLDRVVDVLDEHNELLYWFLDGLFKHRPELFVKFPSTSVPPANILSLQRRAIKLYMIHSKDSDSITEELLTLEAYHMADYETPFLRFIKAILQLGGFSSDELKSVLEKEAEKQEDPFRFALERAFIVENRGLDTESAAMEVLDLYLQGAGSLVHAVGFADRSKKYATKIWEKLIEFCLFDLSDAAESNQGILFGTLLEAAALIGADLAHIVYQIPQGMAVEGLRPRLVSAVNDYKIKLRVVEASQRIGSMEKVQLLRELWHRSKRAARFDALAVKTTDNDADKEHFHFSSPIAEKPWRLLRTTQRPARHQLSAVVPIR